ncbi:BatA domain-containing protein [Hymenobacter crusticola]|nr:BatA domain-containing protein [Hymenobacter crusticola]
MSFTYPWFLYGLLALAIPVIIHLFELRRPKRVFFSNTSFIQEIKLVTARQQKIKHLLVLLARLGFVLFLVLMFCQPFLPAPQQSRSKDIVKVLVDTSPSMQVQAKEEQTAFDKAVEEARGLTSAYPASTYFELLDKPHQKLTGKAYQAMVEQLGVSGHSTSLIKSASRLFANDRKEQAQVYLFSDFQKNDFSPQLLATLDTTQQVFLVPTADEVGKNVYVDSVTLDDAFVRADADIVIRIRLRNGGNVDANNCQVKLFIGERQAAAFQASVKAGRNSISVVRTRLHSRELQKCRVEVDDFPVTFDNTYYFTLQPAPKIKIEELAANSAVTQQLYANEPLFDYTLSKPYGVNYSTLGTANLIVLQEVPRMEATLRENLRQAVQKGATLVIVPPSELAARQSYNAFFHDLGLTPIQWESIPTGKPVLRDLAAPSLQNPFFKDVFAQQSRPTVMPKAAPVLRWSRSGTEVLQMRDGEGYLAGFPSGEGMVYLFSAPLSGGYSDFANQALFVPVMYRLAIQSYRNNQQPAYRLDEHTIALTLEGKGSGAERVFKLKKDSLTFIPAQREKAGELSFDVPSSMQTPGFYQLSRNGQPITTLAFNFDKRESDLAHYSTQELRAMIGPDRPNVRVYDANAGESVAAQYKAERVGTPLWRYCLGLALACLLAEVLLLRFGKKREPALRTPIATAA